MHSIEAALAQRILVLDGAMGTMIQQYHLQEKDYRPHALKGHQVELRGNTDMLNLTQPDMIRDIHLQYLEAGADIISTNTFGANAISQSDYDTAAWVYDINYQGAVIARSAVREFLKKDPSKPRFVAGAIGPTTKLASMSPHVHDPGLRAVSFDQLVEAYTAQAKALIEGGIDLLLLETITDTLNAKAALFAFMQLFEETGQRYPVMVSGTITDASGRILSGQTIEAFLISIAHVPLLAVGLNCALGAAELKLYLHILHKEAPFYVSTHPNAGLPNQFGGYDQTSSEFAALVYGFAKNGWINIVGGCCGTTPEHIKAAAQAIQHMPPRQKPKQKENTSNKTHTDTIIKEKIDAWHQANAVAGQAYFEMKQLMDIIAKVEDEETFLTLKRKFDAEMPFYHPEQAMLLNAHIFGRYQYLKTENRLAMS